MDAFEAISLPEPSATTTRKYFSVTEANRALALVRRIVGDIVAQYKRLLRLHENYSRLEAQGNRAAAQQVRGKYAAVTDRLSELREELEELGCELKSYEQGLVDFPSQLDGRDVLLCWKIGEEKIQYWHETETGFLARQPIPRK